LRAPSTWATAALCVVVALIHPPHTVLRMVYVDHHSSHAVLSEHARNASKQGAVSVFKVHADAARLKRCNNNSVFEKRVGRWLFSVVVACAQPRPNATTWRAK